MVGPILHQEMLLGSRRNKLYIFRWLYGAWLVVQILWFAFVAWMANFPFGGPDTPIVSTVSAHFLQVFVAQQLALVFIATPVFVAGSVSDEKTRGTLQYLMTTDLASWHILFGKLLARVAQVTLVGLAGLPLLCFVGVVGGLEPLTFFTLILVTILPMFAVGAATMLAAVWTKKTLEAVLVLCPILIPAAVATLFFNPFPTFFDGRYVLEPAWGRIDAAGARELGRRLFGATLCWGTIGSICLALAVWRLRPAYIRQLHGGTRKKRAFWWKAGRTTVADSPVRWKEYYIEGLAPLPVLRLFPRWLALGVTFAVSTLVSLFILWLNLFPGRGVATMLQMVVELDLRGLMRCFSWMGAADGFQIYGFIVLFVSTLLVGIRCSGSVSGERERQTWEALLLTPLSVKHLIRGKLWGIMGATYLYLLAYAVPAMALALAGGPGAVFWVVLLLAVNALAVYFMGATGMRCSVRAKTSWRSLLGTLGIGYVGGAIAFLITTPVVLIVALIIYIGLKFIEDYLGTAVGPGWAQFLTAFVIASCIGLALMFWGLAWFFIADAQKWVADRERTRHWHEEPIDYGYRRRRRRPRLRSASY
jgi:ABC-type transport system involved in multi-copper enzyme maturation permease subunit